MNIKFLEASSTWVRTIAFLLGWLGLYSASFANPVQAAEPSANNSERQSVTLEKLGLGHSMHLRGVDSTQGVTVDVRKDQVVTGLKLNLHYSYSPSLIDELSHLKILFNDQVAATLPLTKDKAGTTQHADVDIPSYLATDFNRLNLQFIGHYTTDCEDPLHSSLWARVSNQSELTVTTERLILPNDLKSLPEPFFDRRDAGKLNLPIVFAGAPEPQTLESAALIASWFGALASYRGASFPVHFDQLPLKGNAVVVLQGPQVLAPLGLVESQQPSIRMLTNPNDPYGKLLVVAGASAEQLKQAALALVNASSTFSGELAVVDEVVTLAPRKPYDAPKWLPLDRAVELGELLDAAQLSVSGFDPGTISLPMTLPPSVFHWRQEGAKLNLKYRYTPQARGDNASLLVGLGGTFVKSIALDSQLKLKEKGTVLGFGNALNEQYEEVDLLVPLNKQGSHTALELRFMYEYLKEGKCKDALVQNMRGSIDPTSTFDLRGYEHFVAMPNLRVFQNSGFPFTRMADLTETAIVIPDTLSPELAGALLDLAGHFGDSTGLPASGLTVAYAQELNALSNKDILVLSEGANRNALLDHWSSFLPAQIDSSQRFELSDLTHQVRRWLLDEPNANIRPTRSTVTLAQGGVGNYLAGFESPLKSGRSVVVLSAADAKGLKQLTDAVQGGKKYEQHMQGSLVVVSDLRVDSLVADEQYYVGELGWFRHMQWLMTQNLWLMIALTALVVLVASLCFYASLKARAAQRLKG